VPDGLAQTLAPQESDLLANQDRFEAVVKWGARTIMKKRTRTIEESAFRAKRGEAALTEGHPAMTRVRLLCLTSMLLSPSAEAATVLYTLAIGHNGLPPGAPAEGLAELSFADDDALAIHELARTVARRSVVLALPDRATQARYSSSGEARPPSVTELRRVLAALTPDIATSVRAGDDVAVWLFYSGHGWLDEQGHTNLTLADGVLSQSMLYDEVLPALPARVVHLMIDACHAEALLRPRDATAQTVEVSAAEIATASLRARLGQLPHVGVVMASTRSGQAHEWDEYQTGVFTHELLSGLRGGADVNRDGQVEYSEIAAFLAAANRGVADPRAHLTTLVVAPALYPRATIMNTGAARQAGRLQGPARHLGRFQVDDQRGNRLLDLRSEAGFAFDVVVPADEPLLLSNESGEVKLVASADRPTKLAEIAFGRSHLRSRSAIVESMRRGLFSTEFGPSYYAGYVDNPASRMIPVDLSLVASPVEAKGPSTREHRAATWTAFAAGGVSLAASVALAVLAGRAYSDFQGTDRERASVDARSRYHDYGAAAIGTAAVAVVSGVIGYWLWQRDGGARTPRDPAR
jgi:hypothetical protein